MDIIKFGYVIGILVWLLITFFYGIFEFIANDGKLRDVKIYGSFKHWLISSLGAIILLVIMKYFNLEIERPEEEYFYLFALLATLILLFVAVWTGKIK